MFKRILMAVVATLSVGGIALTWRPALAPIAPPAADSFPTPPIALGAQLAAASGAVGSVVGQIAKLQTQQGRHFEQLELDFSTGLGQVNAARKRQQEAATADLFAQYQDWIRQTLELDDRAQLTVVAVLVG